MKGILSTWLLLAALSLNAQDKKVYIDEFRVTDQVIHGSIDEKYEITMYLKLDDYFEDGTSHTVSGWYYYDNVKKKIPLIGVCSDRFVLYQFADQKRADSIREFNAPVNSMWEVMENLSNRSGYLERFEFAYEDYTYKGTWKNDKKELKVVFNTSDINLTGRNEFLVLQFGAQNKKHFDMKQFGPFYYGYSVFASKMDATGCKVLLQYELSSRLNPNGMCGAGQEIGYLLLTFDAKGDLLDYRDEQVESCLGNIWSEVTEIPNTGGKKLTYKVIYPDEKERTVTVDGINFTLLSK
ncbi:hypothetical protein [Fluviicola sp.]|uniref:hypothetical protein n=1 Tax=Fluviicola sp. TaxID=1917219 RepID=UPI0031DE042F